MGLAHLVTLLLAATLLADGITRALPIDWLTFRPWEAAVQYRPDNAAFEPNRRITCDDCFGDLASMANLPQYRIYRPEVFTTDDWVFRNPPGLARPVRVLLVGDSFTAGAALTDADMLASQLGTRLGAGVYNTAPMLIGPSGLKALAAHLQMSEGWVVVQHLGWATTPPPGTDGAVPTAHRTITAAERLGRSVAADLFPLRILANQMMKPLQNGRLLTNPSREFATIEVLANGQPMLFRTLDMQVWEGARAAPELWALPRFAENAAYYGWLRDQIAAAGLKLAVLLVPHKVTAYHPFLQSTGAPARIVDDYLPKLAVALQAAGIPAIDLSDAFFHAAQAGLATNEPIYWPDDTHWNARGAAIAADRLAERLTAPATVASDPANAAGGR